MALLAGLVGTACESFLDVNKNPNAPVSARIDLTLPGVIGTFGHSVLAGSLAFWTAEWMQQFSFNGNNRAYSNLHRYEVTTIDAGGPWSNIFASVMKESNNIMKRCRRRPRTGPTTALPSSSRPGASSIATDAWGPVPFEDAFNTVIREPEVRRAEGRLRRRAEADRRSHRGNGEAGAQSRCGRSAVQRRHGQVGEAGPHDPGAVCTCA